MRYQRSSALFLKAQQVLPGGVNSPVRAFQAVGGTPIFVNHAKGAYLFDEDGNRYIDYIASWGPMILGHAHPPVIKAIVNKAHKGTSFGMPTEIETTIAELVVSMVPNIDKIRFVNSGTEACMSAIRLARGFTGREKIIKFAGCYHGHSDAFLIQAGSGAVTFGSPNSPGDIYTYELSTNKLNKITSNLNSNVNPDDLVNAEVIRYESFDGLEIPAILYKPHAANKKNKVPALVWVHGGPGGQSRVGYRASIQYLVNHGYAILAVNNRGSSGYGKTFYSLDDLNHGEDDLQDCVWGKKWLQDQDYINPDKIGIIGGSYGGFMTMAAMTFEPEEFKVGVNIYGVTNWIRTLRSIPAFWETSRKRLYKEMGDPYTNDSLRLYDISPLFHAKNIKNPFMVLQGANDPRVLQIESDEMAQEARNAGAYVEYLLFEDAGHGFVKKDQQIEGNQKILTFLDNYLK